MTVIRNERNKRLNALATRSVNPVGAKLFLLATANAFNVDTEGDVSPASIELTAALFGLTGQVTFTAVGATVTNVGNVATLDYDDMNGENAEVTATFLSNGTLFVAKVQITTVRGTSAENIVEQLTGLITLTQLTADLAAKISLIDAAAGVTGSVAQRIKAETDARQVAIQAEIDARIAADNAEVLARNAYVINYSYSKATTDSSIAAQAAITQTQYRAYSDIGRDLAISTASADVRNYAYSKTESNSAEASQTNSITASYQSFANTAASNAQSAAIASANAFTTNNTYSRATIDGSFTSQYNTITANYQTYANNTRDVAISVSAADVRSYGYSKATVDSAIASSTSTLTTTVGNHTTTLQENATSIDGLSAQKTVKIDNNGRVAGYGLASTPVNGVPQSAMVFLVDAFMIGSASYGNKQMFSVGTIGGVTNIGLAGVNIIDKTINAGHINVATLSALSAIIGDLQTATSGARTRIRDNKITMYDSANNIIMEIGEFT